MKSSFVPYGSYSEIINLLGQWKILDMKSLNNLCDFEVNYPNLLHKVRKLESEGLVKAVLIGRKNKHIYLSQKGLEFTSFDFSSELSPETVNHDIITATVLRELLRRDNFLEGRLFHQMRGSEIYPDAEVLGTKNGSHYKLAIEVELTQKSQQRVKEKFRKYEKAQTFNFALFITNKESLLQTYSRYLEEMVIDVRKAIILLWDPELKMSKVNLDKAQCYYMGKEYSFNAIF